MKKYGQAYVGFANDFMFYTSMENVIESDITASSAKKSLGDGAVIIKKENISSAKIIENKEYSVIIESKGLGDGIGVMTGSLENQKELIEDVARFLGKKASFVRVEIGAFKKMFGSLSLSGATAVITYLTYLASSEATREGKGLSGNYSGTQEILANIVDLLGANGVLIIGGCVVLFFVRAAIKKAKQRLYISEVGFQ